MLMSRPAIGLVATLALATACAAPARDPAQVQAITTGEPAFAAEVEAFQARSLERVLARADAVGRGETGDDTMDVLALSGGADWGAFGAGYLARWNELGDEAAVPMPEFDVIGGISTGALIGTYVAAGTPERYTGIEAFYRRTSPDWVRFAGIRRFLPNNIAILDNGGVRAEVDAAVDDDLVAALRRAHAQHRTVAVGTTNLDFGQLQYWELGTIASERARPHDHIVDILMAATAIPGVFPPVQIDGELHADGGAVQGVPGIEPAQLPRYAQAWRERYGERPLPTLRFWYIFNNQLDLHPEAVGLSWIDIVYRSYQTISQTSFKAPVQTNLVQAQSPDPRLPAMEVRWVAIPDSYVADPNARPFDPAVTNALADLGREVADRPDGGWRRDYPR